MGIARVQPKHIVIGLITGFMALLLTWLPSATSRAETPATNTYVSATQEFFIYANAGETVNVSFARGPFGPNPTVSFPITIEGPGGQGTTCMVPTAAASGANVCNFSTVSTQTGIWRVSFEPDPADAGPSSPFFPGNVFTDSSWSWDIEAANGVTPIPGRVWTEMYAMRQQNVSSNLADITFYYQSQDGYRYKGDFLQYNGVHSQFLADAVGNRTDGTCTPVYQSIEGSSPTMSPAIDDCGGRYKIFFAAPATDLPQTATQWDGGTTWVKPAEPVAPTVSNLTFAPDGVKSHSGNVQFQVSDFVGPMEVQIDTNNDGDFNGPEDVTLPYNVATAGNQVRQVYFDGVDGNGADITMPTQMEVRVVINKAAEIHFFNYDVEARAGMQLTRLNGPNPGSTDLSWNDSFLANNKTNITTPIQATDTDSTGGVHGWAFDSASWGNGRAIEDWAFVNVTAQGSLTVNFPAQVIDAVNDTGNAVSTTVGGTSYANVLVNDTLGGVTPTLTPSQTNTVVLTQVSTTHPGVTLNTATGAVVVAPGTPIGNYSLVYRICEAALPANCDTATVTVPVVDIPIIAVDDTDTTPQNTPVTTDVTDNDTINGNPVDPTIVKVTPVTNPSRGTIVVNPDNTITYTPFDGFAGTDTYVYRVCEDASSTNCDTATVTITVTGTPQIVANDNHGGPLKAGVGGEAIKNVLDNDKYNGIGATLSEVILTQISTTHPGVKLNPATGAVTVDPSVPAGTYTVRYRICAITDPSNCAEANATVVVTADGLAGTGSNLTPFIVAAVGLIGAAVAIRRTTAQKQMAK